MGDNIEVPPFFICPISLEIMKDPVILSTGITYDRDCIEKWVFTDKRDTCPVTKQTLADLELTPNHTLRRLIQSWCTLNASFGIERFPTPRPPIGKPQILKLLNDSKSPSLQMKSLKKLKSIAMESATNKRAMEAAGAADFLLASILNNVSSNNVSSSSEEVYEEGFELTTASDEALGIIYHLQLSPTSLKSLFKTHGEKFLDSLIHIMQRANYESRTYAVFLLKSIFEASDPMQAISLRPQFFIELVQILKDQISQKATKATLKLLANVVCLWGRNRIKAVEAGAVSVLIDTLLDSSDKRVNEMCLTVLDTLCQCAEGRAELLKHGAGLAVVSKKILRVSQTGTERGVRILLSVSKFAGNHVVQEMLQLGVVAKLCLLLQVDCGSKTKERAREILVQHRRAWRNSPCIPTNFYSSYPAKEN